MNNIIILDALGSQQTLSTIQTASVHVPQSQNISEKTVGGAAPITALMFGGSDGTYLRAIATDSSGQVKVLIENTPISVSQSSGPWTINLTSISGTALGVPSTYGTSPGAVNVLGVNAFVTNTVPTTGPTSVTASAPTQTTVGVSVVSVLASNPSRKECTIVNTGTTIIYLGLGQTPSTSAYHIPLSPCVVAPNDGTGGTYTTDIFKGAINAISATSGGTLCVTELT